MPSLAFNSAPIHPSIITVSLPFDAVVKRIWAERQTTSRKVHVRRTQNIIINATATAMHDKDPFQSYASTMRGHQYSDQQEPPPLRLSSTSYIVLRLHLHRHDDLRCTTDTLYAKYTLMQQPSQLILPSSVSWFVVLSSSPYDPLRRYCLSDDVDVFVPIRIIKQRRRRKSTRYYTTINLVANKTIYNIHYIEYTTINHG